MDEQTENIWHRERARNRGFMRIHKHLRNFEQQSNNTQKQPTQPKKKNTDFFLRILRFGVRARPKHRDEETVNILTFEW